MIGEGETPKQNLILPKLARYCHRSSFTRIASGDRALPCCFAGALRTARWLKASNQLLIVSGSVVIKSPDSQPLAALLPYLFHRKS